MSVSSAEQPVWVFQAGSDGARPPLVLLHGSYGTESDLLALADRVAPGASRLGVRGSVALDTGYAFFRRHPDRRLDEQDLRSRLPALAALLRTSSDRGRLEEPPLLVGFSNGAIMAAALVASCPELLAGAILFRPLSPFSDEASYAPSSVPVLIIDGRHDHRRSAGDGHRLATQLRRVGATVTHRVLPVGHAITAADEEIAREWLGAASRAPSGSL
jgi:phospholipase/carboxylesterase